MAKEGVCVPAMPRPLIRALPVLRFEMVMTDATANGATTACEPMALREECGAMVQRSQGPVLIVFSGLPGTGKTTLAKALLARCRGVYVRVDEIEHAMRKCSGASGDVGVAGYAVALAISASNLEIGNLVVADCVNPVSASRRAWQAVAKGVEGACVLEIEVVCSDVAEHRRRIEGRLPDIEGFSLPDWPSLATLGYVPWTTDRLVLDTAFLCVDQAVSLIQQRLRSRCRS